MLISDRCAGGAIGGEAAARATPDGYTLLMASSSTMSINPHFAAKQSYDPQTSFSPVILVGYATNVVAVHPSVPVRTIRELIALAKSKPGEISFASNGTGTISHLTGELFQQQSGVRMLHVPYKGAAPAVIDVLAGNVSTMISNPTAVVPHIRTGKLKALGILGGQRIDVLKDVPTAVEQGYKEFADVIEWYGMVAPKATPRSIINQLNAGLTKVLMLPEVQERIRALGMTPSPTTPEEFDKQIRADHALWGRVVRQAGVKAE